MWCAKAKRCPRSAQSSARRRGEIARTGENSPSIDSRSSCSQAFSAAPDLLCRRVAARAGARLNERNPDAGGSAAAEGERPASARDGSGMTDDMRVVAPGRRSQKRASASKTGEKNGDYVDCSRRVGRLDRSASVGVAPPRRPHVSGASRARVAAREDGPTKG